MKNIEKINNLINKMHKHAAWFHNMDVEEAENMLKSSPINTFILRKGTNELHFFLTHVSKEFEVSHHSIRISAELEGYYSNGGGWCKPTKLFSTIEPLICEYLGCEVEDLIPFSNELSLAQGY